MRIMASGKRKNQKQNISKAAKSSPGLMKKPEVSADPAFGNYYLPLAIIVVLTLIVYLPSLTNGFVTWDDDEYIQNNLSIRSIDLKGLFSSYSMGNYHPITMLVYSIEYQLFGLSAEGYHVLNLLIHLLNTVLVFYAV